MKPTLNSNNIDHDILMGFIPKSDISSFLVFENIYVSDNNIVIWYRAPFSEKILVSLDAYNSAVISKNRNLKLDELWTN